MKSARDLPADPEDVSERRRAPVEPGGERFSFQELQDQVIESVLPTHVVEGADVRMAQLRDGASFAFEPLARLRRIGKMRRQDLDRHVAIETRIARSINFAHPPRAGGRTIS
jgi:hypothetical protein